MMRLVKRLFGGHTAPAARGPRRATVRLGVEALEERSLMAAALPSSVPTAPLDYTPDTVFKVGNYWIDVPASYDATNQTPTELLVWSHGCGGESKYDIYDVAATAGGPTYIAIALDGREGGCWDVNADPASVLAAVADVKTHFNIDPRRVVLGGYSSGGDLSYRVAFTHSTEIAGVLAENTAPFRDTGLTPDEALAAPFHFHVVHLAHTEDDTYPIDLVRSETGAVKAAGVPGDGWDSLVRVERPGAHYDDNTTSDLKTFLLPHLADGWLSPGGGRQDTPASPAPPAAGPSGGIPQDNNVPQVPDAVWDPQKLPQAALLVGKSTEHYQEFVTQAYARFLHRQPDAQGLTYWVTLMQLYETSNHTQGLRQEQIEAGFIASPEYEGRYGGVGEAWLRGVYRDLLGRDADPNGTAYWLAQLEAGVSPAQVALGFTASDERLRDRVTDTYARLLERGPDEAGLAYWVAIFKAGYTTEDIISGFVGSQEYYNKADRGASNPARWVQAAYHDVLFRPASLSEFDFWLKELGG
jgi:hypothetical protein